MTDPGEIARFHDRCSDLMRELLERQARSGRWEMWMDGAQAQAVRAAQGD